MTEMKKLIVALILLLGCAGCQVDIKHQQFDKEGNVVAETTYKRVGLIPENVSLTMKNGEITATTGEQAAQNALIDGVTSAVLKAGGTP